MRLRIGIGMARMGILCHMLSSLSSYIIYGNALTNRMEDLKRDLAVGRGCRTHNLPLGGSAVCKGEGSKNTHVGHRIPAEADLLPPVLLVDISEFGYFICWSVGSAARRSSLCLVGLTLMYSFTIMPERQ